MRILSDARTIPHLALSFGIVLFLLAAAWISHVSDQSFLHYGGAEAVALGAESLWDRGTLAAKDFRSLYELLLERSRQCQCAWWQDLFALTASGTLIPARGVVLAIVAAPFHGILGDYGLWLLNTLLLVVAINLLYYAFRRTSSVGAALVSSLFAFLGTTLAQLSYGIHYDLWAVVLLLSALAIVNRYPLVAAFLAALMTEVRPTNIVFVPILFALIQSPAENESFTRRPQARFICGSILGLVVVSALNSYLWGDPLTTGYRRMIYFNAGQVRLPDYSKLFSFEALSSGWVEKLFGAQHSLLATNPILVIGILGLFLRSHLSRLARATIGLGFALQFVLFSSIAVTQPTDVNRYLLPAVLLTVLPVAPLIDRLLTRSVFGIVR